MRVHVLSNHTDGLGIAMRFKQSGHDVRLFGDGGIGLVTKGGDANLQPDVIISTCCNRIDPGRARYLGLTKWSEAIEQNDEYASKVIDLIGWPQRPFPQGTNLYITAWFNGDSTILTYVTILYRRLMAGGCGPDIGRAGSVSLFESMTDKAHETFIRPLEKVLKRVSHQGVFHIHVVTDQNSFYVKGVSTQLYSPLTLTALENTNLAVANVFLKTLDVTSRPLRPLDPVGASLLVTTPPFPYASGANLGYTDISGITAGTLKHIWLEDVVYDKSYKVGPTGAVGHITSRGATPQEACRRLYKTSANLGIPSIQYRNDIGRNINTLIESIRAAGWIY